MKCLICKLIEGNRKRHQWSLEVSGHCVSLSMVDCCLTNVSKERLCFVYRSFFSNKKKTFYCSRFKISFFWLIVVYGVIACYVGFSYFKI
jgi:hypothetical protein